ncbi:MAG: MFS transporter [Acidobacteriaceae bacterium]
MDVTPRPVADTDVSDEATRPTRARWMILFLMSLMYLITYMDRGNISVAAPQIAREFGLSHTEMGFVFSAFVWAYAIGQIPAGWFGDRFGPKKVLTVVMVWWAIASAGTGFAGGFVSLLAARSFLGLGEAGALPVATRGMQLWFPKSERGRIQGITNGFTRLAVAITPIVAIGIMTAFGWRPIFYIFGFLGAIWSIVFYWMYRNRPEDHKGVNRAELAHIRGLRPAGAMAQWDARSRPKTPWKTILGSPNMWYIMTAYGCFFYGVYFFLSWYPTYLEVYRHFSLKSLGFVASIPLFAAMAGDVLGGSISDWVYRRTGRLKFSRRIVAAPAMLIAGLFLIPTALSQHPWMAVLFLALSFFFLDMALGPSWAVAMDVGGEFSGTVSSIMNSAGAIGASVSPIVFGFFVQRGSWVVPFLVTAGMLAGGALVWAFLIDPDKSVVGESRQKTEFAELNGES